MKTSPAAPDPVSFGTREASSLTALLGIFAAAAAEPAPSGRKRVVLDGLAGLARAGNWAWTLRDAGSGKITYLKSGYGWTDDAFEKHLVAVNHPGSRPPFPVKVPELRASARHGHPLVQLDTENGRADSETAIYYGATGAGKVLLSLRKLHDGRTSAIAFTRPKGADAFTHAEVAPVKLALDKAEWLHASGAPGGEPVAGASPFGEGKASVLKLLRSDMSRKEIAEAANLSIHTVNDYVKLIYRHFGVRSRAQLMNRGLGDVENKPRSGS